MDDELQTALDKLDVHVKKGHITKKNSDLIKKYISRLQAIGHRKGPYSNKRLKKIIYSLISMSKMMGNINFDKASQEEIESLVGVIRRKYKGDTPRDYIVMLRMFIRYLYDPQGKKYNFYEYPDIVKNISTGKRYHTEIKRSDIYTRDEIKKLINATNNPRDRCFVSVLYESACRIGEVIGDSNHTGILIKHITFDEYGSLIDVDGKTGLRTLRIITASPTIANWINIHPDKENPNAPLFCRIYKRKGDRISYEYWNKTLKRLAKKAKIHKRMNPHNFRHTRLTHLAEEGLNEAQLCAFAGWEQGSRQASVYIHLAALDLDDKLLSMQGIKKKKSVGEDYKINVCPRCNHVNDPAAKYCIKCNQGLSDELVKDYMEKKQTQTQIVDKLSRKMDIYDTIHRLENKLKPSSEDSVAGQIAEEEQILKKIKKLEEELKNL